MSLPKRSIQYVVNSDENSNPFTNNHTLAALYIKAETQRNHKGKLLGIYASYYPIQLRQWKGHTILVDLLGLNQYKFKMNTIPDISIFRKELESSCENPEKYLSLLRRRANYFKAFTGENTITLRGLLSKVSKEDINSFLKNTTVFKEDSYIFNPLLKRRDITALFRELDSIYKVILFDKEQLEKAEGYLKEYNDVVRKVLEEETCNLKDSRSRIKEKLRRELKKKKDKQKKKQVKEIKNIREALRRKTQPLREERSKEKRRVTRLTNRQKRMTENSTYSNTKRVEVDSMLKTSRERLKDLDVAIKTLEAETVKKIDEIHRANLKEIKDVENKLKIEESKTQKMLEDITKIRSEVSIESRRISNQIKSLIRRKENRLKAILRLFINSKLNEAEFLVPFYIFQYDKNRFSYMPPLTVNSGGGFFSRFRRLLGDSIESKIDNVVRTQGIFMEKYILSAIKNLSKKSSFAQIFKNKCKAFNLFNSRSNLDSMMKGLVELKKRGVMNDSEYVKLQIGLIDRLDEINLQ